jgi:hypothetical protein
VVHTGIRAGGSIKDDSDRKGERGGWVAGVLGFTMAAVFRLALAVVLIPIQAIVSLSQSKPDEPQRLVEAGSQGLLEASGIALSWMCWYESTREPRSTSTVAILRTQERLDGPKTEKLGRRGSTAPSEDRYQASN